ncbi:MAG: ParB/RepB/Spo0J family partition protein [bacterium]|nr:ParB/RepB/Spo0J family partition protein [bacterium]
MALGKGLGSLIPPKNSTANIENQARASEFSHARDAVTELPVAAITVNPHQPRQHFSHSELEELISSIKQYGVLQPLLVSEQDGKYELIAGERRLRASRIAGLTKVPVIVRAVSELEKVELALIENIQRSDLNAIEKAEGYHKLTNEFGLNHDTAAKKIGISRSTFSNTLRLLDLPGEIQKALADNIISEGHAKVLLGLASEAEQLQKLKDIMAGNLSVHALGDEVKGKTKQSRAKSSQSTQTAVHVQAWQDELTQVLATKVIIQQRGDGGTINIKYYSVEELPEIIRRIAKK